MGKIGFIGLGIMGKPMARNLLRGGCELLVNDVVETAVAEMVAEGAQSATYEEIGSACDVVFLSLPRGDISINVLVGQNGLVNYAKPGCVICDTSSVTPVESRTCYEGLQAKGIEFVDAPVSGGEPGAVNGTLAFMAGGNQKAFDALQPYFDIMGSSAILVGGPGSGSVTKLANQIIVNLNIAAVSEALVLAQKAGADTRKVFEAIRGGLAGSAVLEAKAPMMLDRNFVPGGRISINHKDISNVLKTAHELDSPVPMSAQLFEIMQTLKVHGHMGDDHAGIVQYFEMLADVEVKG